MFKMLSDPGKRIFDYFTRDRQRQGEKPKNLIYTLNIEEVSTHSFSIPYSGEIFLKNNRRGSRILFAFANNMEGEPINNFYDNFINQVILGFGRVQPNSKAFTAISKIDRYRPQSFIGARKPVGQTRDKNPALLSAPENIIQQGSESPFDNYDAFNNYVLFTNINCFKNRELGRIVQSDLSMLVNNQASLTKASLMDTILHEKKNPMHMVRIAKVTKIKQTESPF